VVGGHRERLVALDDTARSTRYAFEFDCDAADEPEVTSQVRDGIFLPGLAALKERFA